MYDVRSPHDVISSPEMGPAQGQLLTLTMCDKLNQTYPIEICNVMPRSSDTDTILTKILAIMYIITHKACSDSSMINNTDVTI